MTPDDQIASPSSERQASGWDVSNAPRNYASLVALQIGSALFSFAAVWLITRHLGDEGYGGIVAMIAASQIAQVFVNWTGVAVVRFGVDEFIATGGITRTFWTRFIILAANLILIAALSPLWFPTLAPWLKLEESSLWLILAHFAVTAFWIHIQMSLQGVKLLRRQALLMMVERLLIFGGVFGLTWAAELRPVSAMICYIAAPAMMALIGFFDLREFTFGKLNFDGAFVKKLLTYSLPLMPFALVGVFSSGYIDAVFVAGFLSKADLGVYGIATQINGIALQFPTLANTLLLPLFLTLQNESDEQRSANYFKNVLPTITLGWGLACTLASFAAYFAIPIVFGVPFTEAGSALWILLTASAVGMPVAIGYSALSNAASMTYVPMVAAILSATTNVIANALLIPRYGIVGCAVATLLAFFVSVAVFAILMRRGAKTPISWSFAAFAPCVVGTISFILWQNAFVAVAVGIVAFLIVGLLFRRSLNSTLAFLKNFRLARR
ncbi:MAG: lipopolysaccharide biosynthesis protein [Pyrinomonadaceae bacterium]